MALDLLGCYSWDGLAGSGLLVAELLGHVDRCRLIVRLVVIHGCGRRSEEVPFCPCGQEHGCGHDQNDRGHGENELTELQYLPLAGLGCDGCQLVAGECDQVEAREALQCELHSGVGQRELVLSTHRRGEGHDDEDPLTEDVQPHPAVVPAVDFAGVVQAGVRDQQAQLAAADAGHQAREEVRVVPVVAFGGLGDDDPSQEAEHCDQCGRSERPPRGWHNGHRNSFPRGYTEVLHSACQCSEVHGVENMCILYNKKR